MTLRTCTRTWLAALAMCAGLCCSTGALAQAPANDLCSGAIPMSVNVTYTGSNVAATSTNDGPAPSCQTTFSKSVWYTFNPPTTGNYQISACGALFDSVLSVFDVVDCTTYVSASFHQVTGGCDDDSCGGMPGPTGTASAAGSLIASLPLTAGTNYYIRVSGYSTNSGLFQVAAFDLSANGACCTSAGACSVVAASSCATTGTAYFMGANSTCTVNPCVGACCNNTSGSCAVTLPTTAACASGNTFMGYGSSCTVSPCTLAACCSSTGSCTLTTALACSGGTTTVSYNTGMTCSPSNPCGGSCCNTTTGACTTTLNLAGCNAGAGPFTAGASCTPNPCGGSCCSATGTCTTIPTTGTCTGTFTAGGSCTPSPCVGSCCNVTAGTCSAILASACTTPNIFSGNGTTCTTNPCPPPGNDNCNLPMPAPYHYTTAFTVSGSANTATSDGSYAGIAGGTFGCAPTNTTTTTNSGKEVYFSFTPSANGSLNADLCSTSPSTDSVLSIHTGCPATAANTIGCNDDGACSAGVGLSQVIGVPVTGGVTYLIRVAHYGTASTTGYVYTLNVTTAAVGACCKTDASCVVATSAACTGTPNFGTYMGNATTCGAVTCTGACCDNALATCTATAPTACPAGSTFLGINTGCSPIPCAGQACCDNAAGTCSLVGLAGTCPTGSTSSGPNTTCVPSPCPAAACCDNATGACTLTGTNPCPAGTTINPSASCSPLPCPLHVCCNTATGVCSVSGSNPCPTGSTSDPAVACTVNPCPQPPPPSNDECGPTNPVLAVGVATTGSSIFATTSFPLSGTNCPNNLTASGGSNDVFFTFTALATADYEADTCGSTFDTVISVHSACPASESNLIACDDDSTNTGNTACTSGGTQSRIPHLAFTAGTTYVVRVAGYGGDTGAYSVIVNYNNTIGSCCVSTTCTLTDAANCTGSGTWTSGGVCSPSPCAPAGVCCRGATCNTTITTAAACQATLVGGQTAGAAFPTAAACNVTGNYSTPCCYADYNHTGGVSVQDIFDFLQDWFAGSPYANVGGDGASGTLSVQNIFDYLAAFFAGGC